MTEQKLRQLVRDAVVLDREIAEKTEQLKQMKADLVAEAGSRPESHVPTDGGGASWTAEGADGCVARVTFPAPSLKSRVDGEGKCIEKVRAACGRLFDQLFRPAVVYRPVEGFRDQARSLLGGGAGKVIRLLESKSSPSVSFETKES